RWKSLTGGLRALFTVGAMVRLVIAAVCGVAIWYGVTAWIDGRTSIVVEVPFVDKPVTLLDPKWLVLVCIVPTFYLLRVLSLTDLSLAQQVLQSTLRSLVIAAVAIALSRPSWITEQSKVSTVVLVDVSDSISEKQLAAAKKYLDELETVQADGNLQLITFAEKPKVVKKGDEGSLSAAIKRHVGAGAGTDAQAAMQLAYGLYPDGFLPRMLIISDGNQTGGDLAIEAYRAKEMNVKVSWRTFDQDKTSEIRVVGLTAPEDIKVGQPYEVTAEIWSTEKQNVTLALQQDEFPNPLEASKNLDLREGKNLVKFKSDAKHAGATTYRLRVVKFERDTEAQNNAAVTTAPVKGRPNVLYVEGGILREPGSAGYLQRALEHENIDVTVRGPSGIPSSAKELEKYDLVLVSDVPAHLMGAGQMQALDTYVAGMGGGLIMSGGQDSFGSGGYERTRIETMMPVRFDSEKVRDQPDIALVLVIDKSGSMQGQRIEMAKESARVTTEVLSPDDYISVVVFDSESTVFVRPQRAGNRMAISNKIAQMQSGGGTNIYPGLKDAFEILQNVNAKVKHVILLSDGEAPPDGIAELVQDMRASRITVSAVGVAGSDRNLLQMITDTGEGRLYMVDDIGSLPKVFMKETQEAQKSQLVEDLVKVRIAKKVEAIEGTNVENAPVLHGYVTTKPKPTSETILISDLGEPILARWRYGSGTSVAWTSDVKNRWAVEWIRWGGYPKFWAQVIRSTMRRKVYDSYDLYSKVADGRALVTVDAIDSGDRFVNELETSLEVVDPATNKVTQTVAMDQTAAGRYTADFKIQKYGSYLLKAIHKRDGKTVAESMGSVALSYPLEYLRTTPDLEGLKHAAQVSGGHSNIKPAELWDANKESVKYTQDLWPYVLIGIVGLFILDLYAKRVRLFGYRTIKFQ
ncbi:MAG: VWA domain-containing protein, partial [Deltaproteobacteria bacterium]|nr:VWA domain-containing protein [Deltaproteobacteria bacterium]